MLAEDYLKTLVKIGWFTELPFQEQERLQEELPIAIQESPDYAFYILAVLSIKLYSINHQKAYTKLLKQFTNASFGFFKPYEILELHKNKQVVLFFMHNKKEYEVIMDQNDKLIHRDFIKIINKALIDTNYHSQFIELPRCDDTAEFVLVPKQTFNQALENNLIPKYLIEDDEAAIAA